MGVIRGRLLATALAAGLLAGVWPVRAHASARHTAQQRALRPTQVGPRQGAPPRTKPSADTAPPEGPFLRRNPASNSGAAGLIHVPTAATTPSGAVDFGFDGARTPLVIPNLAQQRNVFIVMGFLPRLTLGARGTVADDTVHLEIRDLSANFQVQLLNEGRLAPAISLGMQDIGQGATPFFQSKFVVATKSWRNRATATVGYGTGSRMLSGVFGGVALGLGPWATALGEYDGRNYNGGVRVFPFPTYADRIGMQPRLDLLWRQTDERVVVSAGLRTRLGGGGEAVRRPVPSRGTPTPRATMLPMTSATGAFAVIMPPQPARVAALEAAEQQLVQLGFENVRVRLASDAAQPTISVEYENRRYNRDEMDALGIVMGVAAIHAGNTFQRMRITVRRVDIPVMTLESDVAAFVAFVKGRATDAAFANQLVFSSGPSEQGLLPFGGRPLPKQVREQMGAMAYAGAAADANANAVANPSRFKLDLFVRPRIETTFLTDLGVADSRVSLLPDAYMQLGHGLVLNARQTIPITATRGFPEWIDHRNADRLLVHQAVRIPGLGLYPDVSALTQFSVGRFGYNAVGFANELDVALADGRVTMGSTLAVFGKSLGDLDHSMAVGTVRLRHPAWDVTGSLTAGRFRRGDVGALLDVSRAFGSTDVGFSLRSSDFGTTGSIRVALPLTPARELGPSRIRPRLPDLHVQELGTTVLERIPVLRRDVTRPLATDHEIGRVYRTRDRLQSATLRSHVDVLRAAVRRWVDPAIFTE